MTFDEELKQIFYNFRQLNHLACDSSCGDKAWEEMDLDNFKKEIKQLISETIDPFDLVQDCNPDCTPEEHAYHQGTWDSFQKLEEMLRHAFNLKGE